MQTLTSLEDAYRFSLFVNPLLGVTLLLFAIRTARSIDGGLKGFLLRVLAAQVTVWVLTHLDKWIKVLRKVEGFPSGHMAFAVCVATALCFLDRRWLAPIGVVVALYGALIVALDYHSVAEILTATLLAIVVTTLFLKRRPSQKIAQNA